MSFVADLPEFEDFDQQFVYDRYEDAFNNASTLNFVIQFDQASAASALNLDEKSTKRFLELERPIGDSTRWINIWGPERQKKLIKVLSDRYHFTPRLLGIMCSEHNPPRSVELLNDRSRDKTHMKNDLGSRRSRDTDPEKNILGSHAEIRNPEPSVRHYSVVSEVWHYYSVDWNSKCKRDSCYLMPLSYNCRSLYWL